MAIKNKAMRQKHGREIQQHKAAIAAAAAKRYAGPIRVERIVFTVQGDGGPIRQGEHLELLISDLPRTLSPDEEQITVFEGKTDNVLYFGSRMGAVRYIRASRPDLF